MTPEQTALFNYLKGEPFTLAPGLDTDSLLDLMNRHRLIPIADPILKQLPSEEREKWKERRQNQALRSHLLWSESIGIIAVLKDNGITAILLKGALLAHRMYGDIALRQFNDIDLLIPEMEMQKGISLLQEAGYVYADPAMEEKKSDQLFRKYKKDLGLYNREKGVFIELHFGIYYHRLLPKRSEKILLDSTEMVTIKGTELKSLNSEANFVYLMFHGSIHQYIRLFWLRDIAECLKNQIIDHEQVLEIIKELKFQRIACVSLELASQFFNAEIPSVYNDLMGQHRNRTKRLAGISNTMICSPEESTLIQRFRRQLFLLNLKPGITYKWSVLRSIFQRRRIKG